MSIHNHSERYRLSKLVWSATIPKQCFYCKEPLTKRKSTLDHLTPSSRGGTNELSNLVIACALCNQAKSDLTLREFKAFIKQCGGLDIVKHNYGTDKSTRQSLLR